MSAKADRAIKLNCVVSSTSLKGTPVFRYRFQIITEKDIGLQSMGYEISRVTPGFTVYTGGDSISSLSKVAMPDNLVVRGIPVVFEPPTVEEFDPNRETHRRIVDNHLKNQIRKRLQRMGYELQDGKVLYRRESADSRNIEAHDAVTYQTQLTPEGRILLFIDVQKRWICRLETFLDSLTDMSLSEKIEFVKGHEVMVHQTPESLSARRIVDYDDSSHGTYIVDPTTGVTMYEYWAEPKGYGASRVEAIRKKLGYEPCKEDRGVFIVAHPKEMGKHLSFPSQALRMRIDLNDEDLLRYLDLDAERERLRPDQRERRINVIFEEITGQPYRLADIEVSFADGGRPRWGTLEELQQDGYRMVEMGPPPLEFANGTTTTFKRGAVNRTLMNAGPYSGRKDLIIDILLPSGAEERYVEPFFDTLASLYSRHNLGNLSKGEVLIGGPTPLAYASTASEFYDDLDISGIDLKKRSLVAILPTRDSDPHHHAVNSELVRLGISSKCMKYPNFKGVTGRTRNHLYNIAACLYERALTSGEAMWVLKDGAGETGTAIEGWDGDRPRLPASVFVGFDVSRVRGRPEVASYAAVCEPRGRVIAVNDRSFKGEYVQAGDIQDILTKTFSAFQPARKRMGLPLTEEVVFFKDGTTRGGFQERDLEVGLERTREELHAANWADEDLRLHYVDVTKGVIHRVFSGDGKAPEGTCIINERFEQPEALIVTTDPFAELSQQPNRLTLKRTVGAGGEGDIERIARQYYDLRFLHWETWMFQPGTAIPLHIVQHMAKQKAYGYDTAYIPK